MKNVEWECRMTEPDPIIRHSHSTFPVHHFPRADMIATAFTLALLATTPVQALGQAPVVAGNRVAARDRALDDALKQAVDQALAYVLDPDTRMRAQATLRRDLMPRARTYVPSYRVLDE